ncbi:drug resistance transporter [Astrocystis sublimbata]|nr:drug resistance transporter [Astrocystis sublimbata]
MSFGKSGTPAVLDGSAPDSEDRAEEFNYLTGWRFYVVAVVLELALFLVNFEITIVGTALVSISNDLNDFSRTSWVVTAYLITYTASLVISAKLSDIFGRKWVYLGALLIFSAFSGGCGGAQTMVQLIIFRAFQGIGGGGLYAAAFVMIFELVPKNKYPLFAVISTSLVALGNALGPIFGVGVLTAIGVSLAVPNNFPYQGLAEGPSKSTTQLRNIDFTGAFLMLLSLALLITGLEEAASLLSWTSAAALAPIIVSAFGWIAFLATQWWFTRPGCSIQPVFPWRFCQNRLAMGLILNSFFTGAVSVGCIIQLPIRYQITLGVGPLQAGVKLLPFAILTPVGAAFTAIICKNRRLAPIYMGFLGVFLQIIGLALLSSTPISHPGWNAIYGFQVLIGFGAGCNIGLVTILMPYVVEHRDLAVALAAGTQFRFLGSAVVISITTAVGNGYIKARLSSVLTLKQIQEIFRSSATIDDLPSDLEEKVRREFVNSFNLQFHIILGFAVASVFTVILLWRRNQVKIE